MIFDIGRCCSVAETRGESAESGEWTLHGGLWVVLVNSGSCIGNADREKMIGAGSILLGSRGIEVQVLEPCRFLALRISGNTAEVLREQLEEVQILDGAGCPEASETIRALCEGMTGWRQSAAAFRLLCLLGDADSARSALPPLVAAAVAAIRENYSRLYGLEELSSQMNVSREHLVRVFRKSMGITPGHYLNQVRIEHAKEFLLQREYTLNVVATLCGYSGANYFCRAFRRETGMTPAAWRAANLPRKEQSGRKEQTEEMMLYL